MSAGVLLQQPRHLARCSGSSSSTIGANALKLHHPQQQRSFLSLASNPRQAPSLSPTQLLTKGRAATTAAAAVPSFALSLTRGFAASSLSSVRNGASRTVGRITSSCVKSSPMGGRALNFSRSASTASSSSSSSSLASASHSSASFSQSSKVSRSTTPSLSTSFFSSLSKTTNTTKGAPSWAALIQRASFHSSRSAKFSGPPGGPTPGTPSTATTLVDGAVPKKGNMWAETKQLFSLAKPEAKVLAIGVVLLIFSSGVSMSIPLFIGKVMDSFTDKDAAMATFGMPLPQVFACMAAVFILGAMVNAGRVILMRVSGERIVVRLRENLFRSIVHQDIAFFDANKSGDLISRLSLDTSVVGKSLTFSIMDGLRSIILAAVGTTAMVNISPGLTGVMMILVPPMAVGAVFYGRYVKTLSKQTQEALGEITKVAEERIGNIRTVRAFAKEDDELKRYSLRVQDVFGLAKKEAFASGAFFSGTGLAGNMTIMAMLWYGGAMVLDGTLTTGQLTSHLMYTLYVGSSLAGLTSFYSEIIKGVGASGRLFELMDRVPDIGMRQGKMLPALTGQIRFDNVSFSYPSRTNASIFDPVSFEVEAGEVVAIVGQSGIGKSTIGSLLLRFYDPTAGRIVINGDTDLKDLDLGWWREQVGLVSQEPVLFSGTILENIGYGVPQATEAQIEEVAKKANCDFIWDFPEKFETMVGERGISLSGGQKQRLAIARALLKNPRILILDEATSALDTQSERLVQGALDNLMSGQKTVITIAHRETTIRSASRVICLDGGKVAEMGTYDELMAKNGVFADLMRKRDLP